MFINLSSFLILKKAVILNPTKQQQAAIASGKKRGKTVVAENHWLEYFRFFHAILFNMI